MSPRTDAAVVSLVLTVLISACASPQPNPASPGAVSQPSAAPKRVVAAINGTAQSVYARLVAGAAGAAAGGQVLGSDVLRQLVGSGLSVEDSTGEMRPLLAEAIPTVENGQWKVSADGSMELTWKIRDGAVWHDGAPITAEDLVFTTRLDRDRNMPWAVAPIYTFVDTVTATDPRTLTARFKSTYILANQLLMEVQPLPRHLVQADYENLTTDAFLDRPYFYTEYVGTGPFKLKELVLDSHIILSAHDRYPLGRPKLDELEVKFIPDGNTLLANVLSGSVEVTLQRNVSLDQGMAIKDRWTGGTMGVGYAGWVNMFVQHQNPTPALMSDVRYRRALVHATDRQQLVDVLVFGQSTVAHSLFGPHNVEYPQIESSIVKYDYDLRRAEQLMNELGYTRAADGMLRDASGATIQGWLMAIAGDESNEKPLLSIADMWKKFGIDAQGQLITRQQSNDPQVRADFPGFSVQGGGEGVGGIPRMHSSRARVAEDNYRGNNYGRYRNPELDAVIDRYQATIPIVERTNVLAQFIRITTSDVANVPLFWRMAPTFIAHRISNVDVVNNLGNHGWNAHLWDVKQ
jgi:peptide/nickel transport system substrate-binding protein